MSILDNLAKFYGTDKSSKIHDYCRKYEKYLPFDQNDEIKILEIGVLGGASLKMWSKYYPKSLVVGIDIKPECKDCQKDNIKIEIGNQTDESFLNSLNKKYGEFDLIIDDGSHINKDVIRTFKLLFKYVKSGGIYVIEDSCTSYYSEYGGGHKKEESTIEYFKEVVDQVNFFGEQIELNTTESTTNEYHMNRNRRDDHLLEQIAKKGYTYIGSQILSLNFLNSLIIITKR